MSKKDKEISSASIFSLEEEQKDTVIWGFKKREIVISKNISANLIYKDISSDKAILYVHGFADHFHNKELPKQYLDKGYSFYALDLRNHGRSIKNQSHKFYVEKIEDYFEEMDVAIYKILERHNKIILNGFSMGGLVTSLYMKKGFYRNHISLLVLTSPLLKFWTSMLEDYLVRPLALGLAKFFPKLKFSFKTSWYKDFIRKIDAYLDPEVSEYHFSKHDTVPFYAGWLKAMADGLSELDKGLNIDKPILILSSDKSTPVSDSGNYDHDADVLLNVGDIKDRSPLLGNNVTLKQIKGATHDIFTSKKEVRKNAYTELFDWIDKNIDESEDDRE